MIAVVTHPTIQKRLGDVTGIISTADLVFKDRKRRAMLRQMYNEGHAAVKTFTLNSPPTWDDIYKAADLMSEFVKKLAININGESRMSAEFTAGFIRASFINDEELMLALPQIYGRLRLELLGVNMTLTAPPPK